MAINGLDKYGVPLTSSTKQTMVQPKRKDQFRVTLYGFGDGTTANITLEVQTCGSPSVEYEVHEVHAYNSKMHYKGKYTWSEIELVVKDTIDNSALNLIVNQWRKEFDHYSQAARQSAGEYKFDMLIETLDGSNDGDNTGILGAWLCQSCLMKGLKFGDGLDYASSEFRTISITIQPDNCLPLDASLKELRGGNTYDTGLLNPADTVMGTGHF
jgi:hypothetical protein